MLLFTCQRKCIFPQKTKCELFSFKPKVSFQKTSPEAQYTDTIKANTILCLDFSQEIMKLPHFSGGYDVVISTPNFILQEFVHIGDFYSLCSATFSFQAVLLRICSLSLICIYLLIFDLRYFSCIYPCFDYQVGNFKSISPRFIKTSRKARVDLTEKLFLILPSPTD